METATETKKTAYDLRKPLTEWLIPMVGEMKARSMSLITVKMVRAYAEMLENLTSEYDRLAERAQAGADHLRKGYRPYSTSQTGSTQSTIDHLHAQADQAHDQLTTHIWMLEEMFGVESGGIDVWEYIKA